MLLVAALVIAAGCSCGGRRGDSFIPLLTVQGDFLVLLLWVVVVVLSAGVVVDGLILDICIYQS